MQRKVRAIALALGFACTVGMSVAATTVPSGSSGGSEAKIEAILNAWQIMPSSQGVDVAAWRDMMRIQLKMASPSMLDSLHSMEAPRDAQVASQQFVGFTNMLGADIAQRLNAQKELLRAKKGIQALGDVGIDQTFVPITPCRVVDTRNVGGAYGGFATRNWYYFTVVGAWNWFTSQGGVFGPASTACPDTFFTYAPSAAVATITVTGQGGPGNLIAWGGENPVASASTMSYPASGDTSSLATIPWGGRTGTGAGGGVLDFAVKVNAASATHVVVDIVGYYTQPAATALQCAIVNSARDGGSKQYLDVDRRYLPDRVQCRRWRVSITTEGTLGYPGVWSNEPSRQQHDVAHLGRQPDRRRTGAYLHRTVLPRSGSLITKPANRREGRPHRA